MLHGVKDAEEFQQRLVSPAEQRELLEYANLKLAVCGQPLSENVGQSSLMRMGHSLVASMREQRKAVADPLCPADASINQFLNDYLAGTPDLDQVTSADSSRQVWLPSSTFVLDRTGLARTVSLPPDEDTFHADIVRSYRVFQGVLHNPDKDKRTTAGVFHVVEGGFLVPGDKKTTPKIAFAHLLMRALSPPPELTRLPFTSTQSEQASTFVSLLLRPLVCPEVPGVTHRLTSEVRFFAPGSLVGNLDFVESIFGNAGDPFLPENDARLDVEHWTGCTGCVILAPHLIQVRKRDIGLPHVSDATPRQVKDGMCWENEDELYNNGQAFKLTCRDHRGVVVTIIADNYFGYCKKETKSIISYSANLLGQYEEEHAGGAIAFPRFDLGEDFEPSLYRSNFEHTYEEMIAQFGDMMDPQAEGYAIDKKYPDIVYLPERVKIGLRHQLIEWDHDGRRQSLKLQPKMSYVMPSGYKVEMIQPRDRMRWRLMGTQSEGTLCHKPCTVSGGGKSEISKPITDAMITGPVLVDNFKRDFAQVAEIINHDFSKRHHTPPEPQGKSRPLLCPERSLGSVVRLLTRSEEYTDEYNEWLATIPRHIRDLVLTVKRFHKSHWGDDWRSRFSVDLMNGHPANELKYRKEKLRSIYLRVGFDEDGSWRTFALRKDFWAAEKIQVEDDITAAIVVPANRMSHLHPHLNQSAYKFVANCETRLFQRPDEAIVRGYDKTAESDFSTTGNFFANYEPLTRADAIEMVEDTILFEKFSKPIRRVISRFANAGEPDYCVSTSHPRVVDGTPTANPRYLQTRPDLTCPRATYLAQVGARLNRRVPLGQEVPFPVNAVLPGRRNNPADRKAGIRPLAVYNPIHYQEWPELFMEFIASLTGKSPSTTGAGSEGALTKGPFNNMPMIVDLNNALVSYLLTNNPCFTTSAGFIGPKYRFDHDISLLIPEVWSRMFIEERDPAFLIEQGCLQPIADFEYQGQMVLASRLGYRITEKFVTQFFGRVFSDPQSVFTQEMLEPERQSMEDYVDGINNIVETQQRIAQLYLDDDSVEWACPPLKALLHIMAEGTFEGKDVHHAGIRQLFSPAQMLTSDWYQERLENRMGVERRLWQRHVAYLQKALRQSDSPSQHAELQRRLRLAEETLATVDCDDYIHQLRGTLGTDPGATKLAVDSNSSRTERRPPITTIAE